MNRRLTLPLATLGLIALAGCGSATPSGDPTDEADKLLTSTEPATTQLDELQWAYFAQLPTLDPAKSLAQGAGQVISNLCDSLLLVQPDFSVSDNLASLSREGDSTLVLSLEEATFWDGTPVEADDVVYSLGRITDPAVASDWAPFFANVSEISARDARTVEITMTQADVLFEKALGTPAGAVMQREFSEAAGESLGSLQGDIMCSGPFTVGATGAGSITLERNADYWNADRQPFVETLVINYLQDGSTAASALSAGEVLGMYNVPANAAESLQDGGAGTLYLGQSTSQFSFVVGNLEDNPLNDVRLRQALSLALDRTAISTKVFGPAGTAATGFYGSAIASQFEGDDATVFAPTPDLEAAKALVEESIAENGQPRPIIIAYTSGVGPEVGTMVLYLQQVAESIGLELELLDEAPPVWFERILAAPTNPSFDMTFTYGGPNIADPYAVLLDFTEGARGNYLNYSAATIDDALAQGLSSTDVSEQLTLALAAQAQLAEDLPRIPVANIANMLFMNDEITGAPASSVSGSFPWGAVVGGR